MQTMLTPFARLKSISNTGEKAKTYCYMFKDAVYFVQIFLFKDYEYKKGDKVLRQFKSYTLVECSIAFKHDSYVYFLNRLLNAEVYKVCETTNVTGLND